MPDIKEVIDMMVADGRPESEITALIDRYNKDNEPGKINDSATADPIAESNVTDSGSESGLLELPEDKGFIEDMVQVFKQSKATAGTIDDAFDIYKLGKDISDEQIQSVLDAKAEMDKYGPTNEQASFAKDQKANGGGIVGTLLALKDNPGFIPQFLVGSAVTMGGSLQAGEVRGATALSAGVGAAGGAAAGSTGFTLGPLGAATTAAGAVTGTFSGAIGGLVGSMETGLTLMDLIQEEVGEGVKLTKENIRAVIDDTETFEKIKQRAAARGRNIGAVEAMTLGISRGVGSQLVKAGKFRRAGVATTAVETTGGFTGEIAGQIGAEQDIDLGEATLEAIGEVTGAGQVINVGEIVRGTLQKSEYNINGEKRSKKEILDLIESDKLTNEEKTKIKFNVKNDEKFAQFIGGKLNDISLETQIDAKVEDPADRTKLVDLEKQRAKAEADTKKSGIFKIINADTKLENVEMQINEIVGKYTAIDGRTKDVRARKKTAQDVRSRLDEINAEATKVASAKTTATVKKQMEAVDKKTGIKGQVLEMSSEDIAESQSETIALFETEVEGYKQKLNSIEDKKSNEYKEVQGELNFFQEQLDGIKTADTEFGYIIDRTDGSYDIVLNKDKPMVGTAAHEFQHKVLSRTLKNNMDIQDKVGSALTDYVTSKFGGVSPAFINRMSAYINPKTGEQVSNFGEEIVTVMSESILDGSLKFNENLFTKVGDIVRQTLQRVGAIDIKFDTGRDVYNFIKDYNRSIEKDYVSKSITRMTAKGAKGKLVEGKAKTGSTVKMSKDASNKVQNIYEEQGVDGAMDIIEQFKPIVSRIAERRREAPNFDRELLMSEIEIGERGIFDLISKYDPDSGVPLAAYINKFLPSRAIEASRRVLGEEFTEDVSERVDIAAEEVADVDVKAKPKKKKIVLADRLSVVKEVDAAIAKIIPNLDLDKITFKNLKNKVPGIVGELFGIAPKKLITNANITKGELQKSQMFINKNADLLIKMLPEGSTEGGVATGVPKTLLNEFYTKGSRAKMAKTGTKAGLPIQQKNNIGKKQFLEVFGIVDGKPNRTDRNTSARVLALANTLGKMITNQTVRQQVQTERFRALEDGKSTFMFSKDKELAERNKIPYYNTLDNAGAETYVVDLVDRVIPVFKPGFLNATVAITTSTMPNRLVKDAKSMLTTYIGLSGVEFGSNKDFARTKFDTKLVRIKSDKEIQALNKRNVDNFEYMWLAIFDAVKKDKTIVTPLLHWLSGSVNEGTHPQRLGAELTHVDSTVKGKLYFEHALQNSNAYRLLMDAAINQNKTEFIKTLKALQGNYKLIAISEKDNTKINKAGYGLLMPEGWNIFDNSWWERYFNDKIAALGGINPENFRSIGSEKTLGQELNIGINGQPRIIKSNLKQSQMFSKAVNKAKISTEAKGITVLDFDDTLATSKSLVISTSPDGVVRKLTAEEFATEGADLLDQGWTHDFSEFSKVVDGKVASLFKKAMKLQGKFGPENMFVLTARPANSAPAIFEFLKANGLNIPLKNITGLANSTPESKALWIADKVGEGYNDFYFADDALQNVQAVKNMLDQFDVKSKVQQAKIKFSKGMNDQFNDILENVTGIESGKRFSIIKGRKRGDSKGKFRVFIPPSHEDFVGLLYNFLGKGKKGNAHRDFFEQALIRPLNRANREYDTARQSIANDYKALNKQFEDVRKKLTKKTPDGDFTFQDAIRVYLWNKHGHKIPGLTKTDQVKLVELVQSDSQLQSYAETLNVISKQEAYVNPTDGWNGGDIRMDLDDATGRVGRKQYFNEFIENAGVIFSEENLNKIEAGYGKGVRESLEDMLYRIETGRNRPSGQNAQVNKLMNYLNGSVGTVMFFNMRSALLQQMSIVNYINFADNNIFAAAKAFANQKQYWKDFAFIFNSDMLKQRRGGIQTDVNGAELAASLRNSKDITRKLISKLLELGFLPTQIGDNIAIATGGAAYYRNRINKYIKQGMSQKEAEAAAFTDFQDITQSTQQSARPDMVSKQQASVIGKVILNFQNVTSQFNRLGKKAFQDIYNRRITKPNTTQMQSDISNASRITYYFAIQNAIFYTLQTALFAMMFDDDEEDDNKLFIKKQERLINGSIDSVLRGSGLIGGVVATLKNVAIAFARQRDVKYNPDESAVGLEALNLSPVLGIKLRKIVNAEKTLNYNKKVIDEMETFDIDNPQWSAVTNYTEAFTNIPLNRLYNKTQNVRQALNNEHAAWERTLMFLGWSQYNLDLENKKMKEIKEKTKGKKKKSKKSKTYRILK